MDIPRYHHECRDGSGYPHGLRGEEIPKAVRVFIIVDIWGALCSDWMYHRAMDNCSAWSILMKWSGGKPDLRLVELFAEIVEN